MNDAIWKKNLQALEEKDKMLYQAILQNPKEEETVIAPGVAEVEERLVLYAIKNEKQYQLDSLYDSDYFVNTWYEGVQNANYIKKYILFGFGNGMYVRKIAVSCGKNDQIIVYEPSLVIFRMALENFDCSELIRDKKVQIIVEEYGQEKFQAYLYKMIKQEDLDGLIFGDYMNYEALFPADRELFYHALQLVYNSILATQDVLERYGHSYYENILANLPAFIKSKSLEALYYKMPKDIPAIVVAAGPSLDKNIEKLKKAKGKCFMIAADSAVKALLAHNIVPDIYVTVDGQKNSAHFADERTRQIPVVCYLLSNRNAIAVNQSDKFFIGDDNPHLQNFMNQQKILLPKLSTGGSVANECFSLAQLMGLHTIILVGQDLAYTGDKTHSSATVRGAWNMNVDQMETTIEIEGIDGKPIKSSTEFQLYRSWFETKIKDYPELKVIDATEGGALIHGTIVETLQTAIEQECSKEVDMKKLLTETPLLMNEIQQKSFAAEMQSVPEKLKYLLSMAKKCIRDYNKMITLAKENKYASGEMMRLYKNTTKAAEEIEQEPAQYYVEQRMQAAVNEVLRDVYEIEQDEKTEIIASCEKGRKYLETFIKETELVIPDIQQKVQNL